MLDIPTKKYNYNYLILNPIFCVFVLGFIIRLYACHYTFIINSDGALYIHQAKAIYYGQWENLISCGVTYLSNYPFFITGAYTVFHEWITAAKAVSFFFGFAALFPLYLLSKLFFDNKISMLITLMFALTPVLVSISSDALRESVYCFFLILGLYLFAKQMNKTKPLFLFMSNLSFLMATWARIEASLVIIVSCLYILATAQEKKLEKFIVFVTPIIIIIIFSIYGTILFKGISVNDLHRVDEITAKFSAPVVQYQNIRHRLQELENDYPDETMKNFFSKARNCVWLIALGTLVNKYLESFFYPLSLIVIIGFIGIQEKIRSDSRIFYFLLLTLSGLILLYIHILHVWISEYRFFSIVIFPCSVFAGFGLQKIISYLQYKWNLTDSAAISICCILILIFALPKDLRFKETDKAVFKEIGEFISKREGNEHEIIIATSRQTQRWISLYANLNCKGAPCPERFEKCWELWANDYENFIRQMKQEGVTYFLWDQKYWSREKFDIKYIEKYKNLKQLGKWYHQNTGTIILFELVSS